MNRVVPVASVNRPVLKVANRVSRNRSSLGISKLGSGPICRAIGVVRVFSSVALTIDVGAPRNQRDIVARRPGLSR
jgi:hypothetical protein